MDARWMRDGALGCLISGTALTACYFVPLKSALLQR